MPEKYPDPPWQDGARPTVGQLGIWLRTFGPQHDARIAADLILSELTIERNARRQAEYERDLRTERLRFYARRAVRYRSAWLSARRRYRRGALLED